MKKLNLLISSLVLISLASCSSGNNALPTLPIDNNQAQQSSVNNKFSNFKSDLWSAQSRARSWDLSAELVRAESRFISENGFANWTFYFKSPFKRNAFKVDLGFGNEVINSFFGREIREFDIRVDADKAIEKAKTQGLKKFPISEMTLEKRSVSAQWEIRNSDGTFRISAEGI